MANDKDKIKKWTERISAAKRVRDQFWAEWEKNYKETFKGYWMKDGKATMKTDTGVSPTEDKYQFDLLQSFLKIETATLMLYRPEVFLNARPTAEISKEDAQKKAKKIESHVNTVLGDMDGLELELKCGIIDADCAIGIAKTTFSPVWRDNPNVGKPILDEGGNPVIDPKTNMPFTELREILDSLSFNISTIRPNKFLVDSKCGHNLKKAKWLGEEIDQTLEDLKGKDYYNQSVVKAIRDRNVSKSGKETEDWEIDVKVYEIYDRHNDRLIAFVDDYDEKFLRNQKTPDGIDKDPYSILLAGIPIPGQVYNKPPLSSGRSIQKDYETARQWQKDSANKSRPLTGIKKAFATASPEEVNKIKDGISTSFEFINEGDVVNFSVDHKTPEAILQHMEGCLKDFDQTMGQTSQDRGLTGKAKFATEVEVAAMEGKVRDTAAVNDVTIWLTDILEKLLKLMKAHYDEDFKSYVTVEKKIEPFTFADLDIDVDVEIDLESKTPKNKAIERKQLTEVLTIIANNPMFLSSPTLLDQIFRDYDIRERDKIITELQEALKNQSEGNTPKGSVNLSFKGELLDDKQLFVINSLLRTNLSMEQAQLGQGELAPNEAVAAGTEGMEAGAGMMPSGEMI